MTTTNDSTDLSVEDRALVEAARLAIASRYSPDWHVVGAALRLRNGTVVSGVHLEANVGRIAVCAEAVALGRAVTEHGTADIDTIVAVFHHPDGRIAVVSPCGMCRELISDYAPHASVLLHDDDGRHTKRPIGELLPGKYQRGEAVSDNRLVQGRVGLVASDSVGLGPRTARVTADAQLRHQRTEYRRVPALTRRDERDPLQPVAVDELVDLHGQAATGAGVRERPALDCSPT